MSGFGLSGGIMGIIEGGGKGFKDGKGFKGSKVIKGFKVFFLMGSYRACVRYGPIVFLRSGR